MSVTADRVVASNDGTHIDVVLRVSAGAQDLHDIAVFWIIAAPGVERPWDAPRYVAPAQTLTDVPAGTSRRVDWIQTPLALPPGNNEITGWVHQITASGATQHLAGGSVGRFAVMRPVASTLRLGEDAFNKPLGPLVLESLELGQESPRAQTVSVDITVRNRGSSPVAGRTQMVVNRFVDPEPFRLAFWQTDWATVPMLNPGESDTVSWTVPIGLPAGTYGLSVWLHARIDSVWEHSQATFNIPLTLGPNASRIQRAQPPTSSVRIEQASLVEDRQVRLVVENAGADLTVVAGAELLPERRRFDWYLASPTPHASLGSLLLPQHSQRAFLLPVQVDCASEDRFVHVTLFAEGSTAEVDPPADDVLVDACA